MKKIIVTLLCCFLASLFFRVQSYAQSGAYNPGKRPHDWWQADWKKDSLPGISLDEAYNYLKGRKSKQVVVAILDDCVDTAHEELKDYIWTNTKEIPRNGIDDDHNGYVDDMHGWCFVANKNNVLQEGESSDEVRTYLTWRQQFEDTDTSKLKGSLKIQYAMYELSKKRMFDTYHFYQLGSIMQADTTRFIQYINHLLNKYKNTTLNNIPFATLPFSNTYDSAANVFWSVYCEVKIPVVAHWPTLGDLANPLKPSAYLRDRFFREIAGLNNKEYDTTKNYRLVIGDDDNDFNTKYGTPAINLIPGEHATTIAGIISANRQNNTGIKGIADNVLIMPVIINNNGAARDKNMVFAIHYAVDNGASVINISFAGVPPIGEHVKEMMEAFDYASKHGVLIVNAAGNESANMDNEIYNFGQGTNGKDQDEYIRVGATTTLLNDYLVSIFSNYGEKSVDLFAPGSAIYSSAPGNKYGIEFGTSFSCPIVTGVAALLKSYFPSLTAKQIKEILMKSVYKPDIMVISPLHAGITNKMPFSKMSKSGGIVNAYNAVKLADEMTKK